MDDKALVERLRDRGVCSIAQNSCRNDYICEEAATRIEAQATRIEALEAALPDEIDLFRIIRKAGRSDIVKAKAVYDRIQQALESQP